LPAASRSHKEEKNLEEQNGRAAEDEPHAVDRLLNAKDDDITLCRKPKAGTLEYGLPMFSHDRTSIREKIPLFLRNSIHGFKKVMKIEFTITGRKNHMARLRITFLRYPILCSTSIGQQSLV